MRRLTAPESAMREGISLCIFSPIPSLDRFYRIGTGELDTAANESLIRGRAERARNLAIALVRSVTA